MARMPRKKKNRKPPKPTYRKPEAKPTAQDVASAASKIEDPNLGLDAETSLREAEKIELSPTVRGVRQDTADSRARLGALREGRKAGGLSITPDSDITGSQARAMGLEPDYSGYLSPTAQAEVDRQARADRNYAGSSGDIGARPVGDMVSDERVQEGRRAAQLDNPGASRSPLADLTPSELRMRGEALRQGVLQPDDVAISATDLAERVEKRNRAMAKLEATGARMSGQPAGVRADEYMQGRLTMKDPYVQAAVSAGVPLNRVAGHLAQRGELPAQRERRDEMMRQQAEAAREPQDFSKTRESAEMEAETRTNIAEIEAEAEKEIAEIEANARTQQERQKAINDQITDIDKKLANLGKSDPKYWMLSLKQLSLLNALRPQNANRATDQNTQSESSGSGGASDEEGQGVKTTTKTPPEFKNQQEARAWLDKEGVPESREVVIDGQTIRVIPEG